MAEESKRRGSKRDELVEAGIREINQYGITGFSMRRIAEACGVSCGAPYKHFGNRKGFIAAVIEYVNAQWHTRQQAVLQAYQGDTRRQIVEISVAYVRFLVEHPHFRSILMLKDDEFDNIYHRMRGELSSPTQKLVRRFQEESGMDPDTLHRKTYVLRALIFGAALMFDNGELTYNEANVEIVRSSIDREFDLP